MKIFKTSQFDFPKWCLPINGDLPENYIIHKSKSSKTMYSENTLCMVYNKKKIKLLILTRVSTDSGYSFCWGSISNNEHRISDGEVLMWTFIPSEQYLKDKYMELIEISEDVK